MPRKKSSDSNRYSWAYKKWSSMMTRALGKTGRFCYQACTVSDSFSDFKNFLAWAREQPGYGCKGFQLDKDILIKGNRQYSESSCCFVPSQINYLFIRGKARRGDLPIGVRKYKNRYRAEISIEGKKTFLGCTGTIDEAFLIYKNAKEAEIKRIANLWIGKISNSVYEALINYTVEITD